jgi:hypothetical protein
LNGDPFRPRQPTRAVAPPSGPHQSPVVLAQVRRVVRPRFSPVKWPRISLVTRLQARVTSMAMALGT